MKVILLTGATDGIGYEAAKQLVSKGHHVLLHGRSLIKLQKVKTELSAMGTGEVETFVADLSKLSEVADFAKEVSEKHEKLDVIINNAGVFKIDHTRTQDGLDVRFAVNTIAPYYLTQKLLPLVPNHGRVINLSSAAQAPVNLDQLAGNGRMSDNEAYAQSKLAIAMWSYSLSLQYSNVMICAVNPASFLGSKMVKEAYGVPGKDLKIGADILCEAALSKKFERASGKYFDNDIGSFQPPHPDGTNKQKSDALIAAMDKVLSGLGLN